MHGKTLAVLLSASSVAVAQLEKKQFDSNDDLDSIYSSVYSSAYLAELSSLDGGGDDLATLTSGLNMDLNSDLSTSLPEATGLSDSLPSITGDSQIPASIESVIATAVPQSFLSQMADPTAASSIVNEIEHGHYPSWYEDLPSSVKSWLQSHYAGEAGSSGSSGSTTPGAASTGMVATGLLGAAGVFALAVLL